MHLLGLFGVAAVVLEDILVTVAMVEMLAAIMEHLARVVEQVAVMVLAVLLAAVV
jgi:hypothetical protein